jgi:hypothetical protein
MLPDGGGSPGSSAKGEEVAGEEAVEQDGERIG